MSGQVKIPRALHPEASYEPERGMDSGVATGSVVRNAGSVFVQVYITTGGKPADGTSSFRCNDFVVYAPGIDPLAVERIKLFPQMVDPYPVLLDYGLFHSTELDVVDGWLNMSSFRHVEITFKLFRDRSYFKAETVGFTEVEQFVSYYEIPVS